MKLNVFIFGLLVIGSVACQETAPPPPAVTFAETVENTMVDDFLYDLNAPNEVFRLPDELEEISGLSYNRTDEFACVQDEEGAIYFFNTAQKKVVDKVVFAKKGDFEGVEVVGSTTFALRSDGTLFEIQNLGLSHQKTKKFETSLDEDFDTEGLGLDAANARLLIACKGVATHDNDNEDTKAIYAFDLVQRRLLPQPVAFLRKEDLFFWVENHPPKALVFKMKDPLPFHPSGIAVHPQTGDWYWLAADGQALVVTDAQGKIKHVERLRKRLLPKPEGITFDLEGRLFIASEGEGEGGKILQFDARKR